MLSKEHSMLHAHVSVCRTLSSSHRPPLGCHLELLLLMSLGPHCREGECFTTHEIKAV